MNIWKRYSMRVSKNWVKFNKMFTLSPWLDGLGWAVLPSPLIQSQLRQGELLTLKHKFSLQWRDYGVYLSENAHHGKVLAWLKKAIEAYLEPFE